MWFHNESDPSHYKQLQLSESSMPDYSTNKMKKSLTQSVPRGKQDFEIADKSITKPFRDGATASLTEADNEIIPDDVEN